MKTIKKIKGLGALLTTFLLVQTTTGLAQDLTVLSGTYSQAAYQGYPMTGFYNIELIKDSYTFTSGQFELVIALPPQGAYDASRAAEAVIPAGWELVVISPTELLLQLEDGATYAGTGLPANRRRNFSLPIITSAPAVDQPSLVEVQWNDFGVDENDAGNTAGSVLNVGALPVTLVSFSAAKEGSVGQLTWSTTEETNSDHFEVQRSLDGKVWTKIGIVVSNGESTVLREYRYTDLKPWNGVNLYRLRMVDKDDTFTFSTIKSVRFEGASGLAYVYPNPSTDRVFLNTEDLSGVRQVSIVDLNGRAVLNTKAMAAGIDVKGLSSGAYVLKVYNVDGTSSMHKFVINR